MIIPNDLRRAIDAVILAGDGQRALLGNDPPDADMSQAEGILRYGAESPAFAIWRAWHAVQRLKAAMDEIEPPGRRVARAPEDAATPHDHTTLPGHDPSKVRQPHEGGTTNG